jgi:hypothetical protein
VRVRRIETLDLGAARPNWLTAGSIRLGLLSLFVVLTAMVRPRLTHWSAGWLLVAGLGFVLAAGALFALATRRVALALPFLDAPWRLTDAVLLVLRRIGLPLLGLAFFLVWTFVYVGIWWAHPHDAFRGLEEHPRFADFFYTAVSTAFISPPGDIVAHSRGARAATMIEMLTAFALVTAYAGSFLELRGARAEGVRGALGAGRAPASDTPE